MSLADQLWCPTSVQVTVLQARGLRIKGKSGTNDAYAVMQVGKEKYQTSVVEKSVAPVWKEEAAFDLPPLLQVGGGGGGTERSTLHIHVLHRALVGPDKLLGQAVINLLQLSEDKTRNKTGWFKLLDKTGKPDKDRGEVLVDIQFMRNNMTASMFDLSAAGKSRSRLGKFKDKVRGKKKESDAASSVVPSFTQVLTDSEEEEGCEVAAGKDGKNKKHKMKSLFSPKSNLQRNMSQSMSILPAKNSSLSGSQSSGLNVDSSEGKKKFKFLMHKRSGSSDSKNSSSGHQKQGPVEQSNLCINGSHIYREESQPRTSRIGSNFSLTSSGHGSMEDVPENSPPSVDSLRAVRQYSPWTEEEEEEETGEVENLKKAAETRRGGAERTVGEEGRRKEEVEEKVRRQQEELERLAEEKRQEEEERRRVEDAEERRRVEDEQVKREEEMKRQDEEEKVRRQQEKLQRLAEEEEKKRAEEEKVKREREERVQREEEWERLAEEKKKQAEQERRRIEEEEKRQREERIRREEEKAHEETSRRQEEERKLAEEKRRREEEDRRRVEEENVRKEDEMRREEEELVRRQEEEREEEERRQREEEERIRKEEVRRQEEERKRIEAEEKIRKEERIKMEEERRRKEEENKARRREEEEKRQREKEERIRKEEVRRQEEERKRIEAEEKIRKEERIKMEEERRRKEEENKVRRREEEEKRQREKEERIRKEEVRRQEEERKRIEAEEKIRKEERIKMEEERRRKEEENGVRRREEEEKRQREEEERIRKEEVRRKEEEERARKKKEECKKLVEEKLRQEEQKRIEEEERIRKEEHEMMEEDRRRQEEEERVRNEKEEMERLAEESSRLEEQEKRIEEEEKVRKEEEERIRREERAKRKEEEAKKLETEKSVRNAEEREMRDNKTKDGQRAAEKKSKVTSTNPFDEDSSDNPSAEIPDSASLLKEAAVQQSCQSSAGGKTVPSDEKDLVSSQREKGPAPRPPGRNQAEKLSRDVSTRHLAQINKQSNKKDVKTVSGSLQRSVQMISPLSRSPTDSKNTLSLMQSNATKGAADEAKDGKRPAPSVPRSVEETPPSEPKTASSGSKVYNRGGSGTKQDQVVYGLNPFEDDEDESELTAPDDATVTGNTGSINWPPAVSQDAAYQTKIKSSKVARAPPPPAKNDTTSSNQNSDGGLITTDPGESGAGDQQPEAGRPVKVQENPLQESQPVKGQNIMEAGVKKEEPPVTSRRLQPVKPLNPLEQQPDSIDEEESVNKSTWILSGVQDKTKINDTGMEGPFCQLTREELIALLLKQEKQLSERDGKISELEQYIDHLLVRVIEEQPSILMSINSLKKAA
ncbi:caldesmon-like [Brachyistius frenatus]|uniref:caldesmon-like n=1 Tax=Brachyistius frenatus TaxID=100188 RepID=UPI0037E8850A